MIKGLINVELQVKKHRFERTVPSKGIAVNKKFHIKKDKTAFVIIKPFDFSKYPNVFSKVDVLVQEISALTENEKIDVLNGVKEKLHKISPFANEPVDCVQWVPLENVRANDYNPNSVAPPEMILLEHSITQDGYTQPVVTWQNEEGYEVVDGFHRNMVARGSEVVFNRLKGRLPVVAIKTDRIDRGDRIASTIRHNRARGKHKVDGMSYIVVELKKRNWSDERIGKELGMEPDEVLRLCQVSGLTEVFQDQEFSKAWEAEIFNEDDFQALEEEDIK